MAGLPDLTRKPLTKKGISEELIGQELFLYDRDNNGTVHCLNSGAAIIWLLCDGTRNLESIAGGIANIAELPKQQILVEVQETVMQFKALGLLES